MAVPGTEKQQLGITSDRWQLLEEIFQAAIERPTTDRRAFIEQACAGDTSLSSAAEKLVASFDEANDFIETPAFLSRIESYAQPDRITNLHSLTTGELPREWQAGLAVGKKIQQYELLSLLGAGGMGEVYFARDGRLNRPVALKLLPPHFTTNATHIRRFEKEAYAASSLNHPNIITIHEIGQVEDTHFIVTEFIEGRTLREMIRTRVLSLKEVTEIATQIASALSAAHAAGIIHRDIKPENIMVRPDGLVKILDFGLAAPAELDRTSDGAELQAPGSVTDSRTLMGTTNYLSPEQVCADAIDHRTDIFSLGVVIYEMIARRSPFAGSSVAATFDAILSSEPPPIVGRELPEQLSRILQRALHKDRHLRYQTAAEMASDLRALPSGVVSARSFAFSKKSAYLLIGLLLLTGLAYLFLSRRESKAGGSKPQLQEGQYIKQTVEPGPELSSSLSSDGSMIVYASRGSGNWDVYIQSVRETDSTTFPKAVNLTADSRFDEIQPAFSPDSKQIVFRRDGVGVFVMNLADRIARKISDTGYTPVWSRTGEIILAEGNGQNPLARTPPPSSLHAVNLETGKHRIITAGDAVQPSCSPNGHRVAYWGMRRGGERDIWTVSTEGGKPVEVTNDLSNDWNPVWSPDGKFLYFASDRDGTMNLWRIQIDEQSGETAGKPEPVKLPGDYVKHFAFALDGHLMIYVQETTRKNLYHLDFNPSSGEATTQATAINQGSRLFSSPDVSPDGRWLVFTNQGEKQEDLFVMRRDGTGLAQITNDSYKDRGPRWSPDGNRIAFYSDRSGEYEIWLINPDGTGLEQLTYTPEPNMVFYPVWSPDSRRIQYRMSAESPYIIEIGRPWDERSLGRLPAFEHPTMKFGAWDWSPDGSTLAGLLGSSETGSRGIMFYSFQTNQFQQISDFGSAPRWLSDNRRLLFYDQGSIYLIDSRTGKSPRKIYSVAPSGMSGFAVSKDDRSIYFSMATTESDIWLRRVE